MMDRGKNKNLRLIWVDTVKILLNLQQIQQIIIWKIKASTQSPIKAKYRKTNRATNH